MNAQIGQALALLQRHLGDNLLSVHLFGSAVVGGLQPGSDLDLLATISEPLTAQARGALMSELLTISAWPASDGLRPLEVTLLVHDAIVPWRYPAMRELQFGEWLRADIEAGRIEPPVADHDLAILLGKVREHSVNLLGPEAACMFPPVPEADRTRALHDTLAQWNQPADWQDDECNVVLAVARIGYTLSTGKIATKDVAANWLLERLPQTHRPVLARARAAYLGLAPDDLAQRPQAVAAFILHARRQLDDKGERR